MRHPDIPKIAYSLFKWFCKEALFEELEGDLEETFVKNLSKLGKKQARRTYTREVLRLVRPSVFKKRSRFSGNYIDLLRNYTILGFRNITRHKVFSFINIFGLTVAMSTGLLVIGMINDLLKFDEFHEHKNEIYRVISTPYYHGQKQDQQATSPIQLGKEIKNQIPGINLTQLGRRLVGEALVNQKRIYAEGIYADEHFFDFLTFQLTSGDPKSVLNEPFSVVISESFASKVFGAKDPIGQIVEFEHIGNFIIKGVAADAPKYSHIQFDVIGSLITYESLANQGLISKDYDSWDNFDSFYNYVHIPNNRQLPMLTSWLGELSGFYKKPEEVIADFELQQINQIVPGKDLSDQIGPKMMMLPIIILSTIALAILLSAIFNYTNLSMARAMRRAREVGVRKLNGASSAAVFLQFTVEAILLAILSLGLGILLFLFLRPGFLEVVPRASEVLNLHLSGKLVLFFLIFSLFTGLIAGLAPSFFFSKLTSLKALTAGSTLKTLSRINFRRGLIIAQFTLSVMFIFAIVIVHKQYQFSLNHDLGFDRANILNVKLKKNDPTLLSTALDKIPEVEHVSYSSIIPGVGQSNYLITIDERNQDSVWVKTMSISPNYFENHQLPILAGRNFRLNENSQNESSIIVNETFVKNFGLSSPEEALGEVFQIEGHSVAIIGVVKDFLHTNLERKITSLMIRNRGDYQYANIKLSSTDLLGTIHKIEESWESVDADNKMEAQFYDDQIELYYQFFVDIMKLFGFIGFLAVSISSLGLFGMTIYTTEIRLKELGIRKVFGATEKALVFLLSKHFLKLVVIAIVIGTPICYLIFDQLILEEHYYRPNISIVDIIISALIILILSIVTVSTQTISAARKNPSDVLRNE